MVSTKEDILPELSYSLKMHDLMLDVCIKSSLNISSPQAIYVMQQAVCVTYCLIAIRSWIRSPAGLIPVSVLHFSF